MASADTPDDPAERRSEQLRRRMKAARALADITVEQLAERITGRGLGAKTLYNIERGERPLQPREIDAIARACGVPPAFFTVDLDEALDDGARRNERVGKLERQVEDIARAVEGTDEADLQRQLEEDAQRLSTVEARQAAIGETLAELAEQLVAVRQEMREHRQDA